MCTFPVHSCRAQGCWGRPVWVRWSHWYHFVSSKEGSALANSTQHKWYQSVTLTSIRCHWSLMQSNQQLHSVLVIFRTHKPSWTAGSLTSSHSLWYHGDQLSPTSENLQAPPNSSLSPTIRCFSCSCFKWNQTCFSDARMIDSNTTCFLEIRPHLPIQPRLVCNWTTMAWKSSSQLFPLFLKILIALS